ncbi:hypothetical protein PILCRDRAFT_233063 [Piloderma croceum F 1598]|uniref:Uncharacterized protein n=1 Tax=Piloderma croceum (strain F 1598) TaxID=765440 RepID=A0A0C3BQ72_PILCF|nr:hypothetical protein PILCRDRAFT_233063 [Piloderma croceum F 1598]
MMLTLEDILKKADWRLRSIRCRDHYDTRLSSEGPPFQVWPSRSVTGNAGRFLGERILNWRASLNVYADSISRARTSSLASSQHAKSNDQVSRCKKGISDSQPTTIEAEDLFRCFRVFVRICDTM